MEKIKKNRYNGATGGRRKGNGFPAVLILFMQNGTIIEQGDHETLLAQNGAYAKLYYSQFA